MKLFALIVLLGLIGTSAQAQTVSIFGNSTPNVRVEPDHKAVTLGLKFYSTQPGSISAIRFYRGAYNTSGYVARLYAAAGGLLGSVSLPSDSRHFQAGWETGTFPSPIPISANTTYIVAYYTSNGQYGGTDFGLTNAAQSGPLVAWASGMVGGNGVYAYGAGFHFPTQTYDDTNYYVDVLFTPTAPMLLLDVSPTNPSVDASAALGTQVATFNPHWSDGSPFTGSLSFSQPYSNDQGKFTLSGNSLIINPAGPGLSGDGGTVQNVTVTATQ